MEDLLDLSFEPTGEGCVICKRRRKDGTYAKDITYPVDGTAQAYLRTWQQNLGIGSITQAHIDEFQAAIDLELERHG
jgi:hypothetical protein